MICEIQPLPFRPNRLEGRSDRLPICHDENNDGSAVRRPNAVERRLEQADYWASLTAFELRLGARAPASLPGPD